MQLKFEAAIFNEEVLTAIQDGEHHKNLSDSWAETHYFEIYASSLEDAWEKMRRKYSAERGFVIKSVEEVD
ncbi:hypothetical protein [uncultured Sneathiella sp.]|mgnify:CR=1 FL=1|jgi:hypothetical protein|uniref:hypothetical protein n=1 Tax=uncultured Sneathiella sp. TaxID=879315 RepID=UPI0030D8B14B|tara:strand:+ start:1154 stop:1366 length:213 start_codon:yes stop_codon:yes gene_type:complete